MDIFIQQREQKIGPLSLAEVEAGVEDGNYDLEDLGWHEGSVGWRELNIMLPLMMTEKGALLPAGCKPAPSPAMSWLVAGTGALMGFISFFTLGFTGVTAVIFGHMALRRIKRSAILPGAIHVASAPLVMGYLGIALGGISWVVW